MNFKKIFIEIHFPMGTLSDSPPSTFNKMVTFWVSSTAMR